MHGGRPARREVASREIVQRLVPVDRGRRGDALVKQCVRELFPAPRSADDEAVELCLHQETYDASRNVDAGAFQCSAQFASREAVAVAQRPFDGRVALAEHRRVELVVAIVERHRAANPGCRKLEHPANVFRQHEMPGGPQDVGSQDRATGNRALDIRFG